MARLYTHTEKTYGARILFRTRIFLICVPFKGTLAHMGMTHIVQGLYFVCVSKACAGIVADEKISACCYAHNVNSARVHLWKIKMIQDREREHSGLVPG